MHEDSSRAGLKVLWQALSHDPALTETVRFTALGNHLPSVYDVSGMALALTGVANLAMAELWALRRGAPKPFSVELSGLEASAIFKSEGLLAPQGWQLPPPWDPIAGDYQARDGWVRLHTNYDSHRKAALAALGISDADRTQVAHVVAKQTKRGIEESVIAHGGCAAAMLTEDEWATDADGSTTLSEPVIHLVAKHLAHANIPHGTSDALPLTGVKVLDLTRVLAGPECTRFLAAWGATVLRIDPPGFDEVPALVPDVTVGKLCASLSLRSKEGQERFLSLVQEADVLVVGYRADALSHLGLTEDIIYSRNPRIILAKLNAYGWAGSLQNRRGFDSLVQMKTGIAARGMKQLQAQKPMPLPAQALDHGAGFMLAAGICRALCTLWTTGTNVQVLTSLVGMANGLRLHFNNGHADGAVGDFSTTLEDTDSEWGRLRRVRSPGLIDERRGVWHMAAGSLGRHPLTFECAPVGT